MSNSPRFAADVLACALLAIMLWAACAGIGWQLIPRSGAPRRDDEPASWRQPGVAACVGLGLLLMLSGIAMVLRIPWWLVVVPYLVLGVALAIRSVSRVEIRDHPRSALVMAGVGAAALLLIALVEAPVGLRFPLNFCDDLRAYLPMAHRFVATSGLEEAWSSRRVQSLGGFDLLRALPVAVFGNAGAGVAETVVASVFLAGIFVANGVRSTWARLVTVGLILATPFLWVPRTNTTGVLMGVPLLVGVLGITVELRRALREQRRGRALQWALLGGLVAGALMSVRPNLGLLAALFLAAAVLSASGIGVRERFQALVAAGLSAVAAIAPWSFAMWRTAGTPLYPLSAGNLNSEAAHIAPLSGAADLAEHVWDLISAGPYFGVSLGVLVAAVAARRFLPDAPLVAIAAAITVLVTIAFALSRPSQPAATFVRYTAPQSGALAVFLICEVLRQADLRSAMAGGEGKRNATSYLAVAGAIALGAVVFSVFGFRPIPFPGGFQLVEFSIKNQYQLPPSLKTSTPLLRSTYEQALKRVDPHRTIVAVDRPFLIDYTRFDVPNLDAPGYMTPDGRAFPFFTGPRAKIGRLREHGFDTLIATDPDFDVCLSPARLNQAARDRPADRAAYRLFLDWTEDVQAIVERAPDSVRHAGSLLVIDLRRAERELAGRTGASSEPSAGSPTRAAPAGELDGA